MKKRGGFVSNSSSSSFIIQKKYLNNEQIDMIKDHITWAKKLGIDKYADYEDAWRITDEEYYIEGYAHMDNFSMYEFLQQIDVDVDKAKWGD